MRKCFLLWVLLWAVIRTAAQDFVNLTAQQVRIDSVLPRYACEFPLGSGFADSAYTVSIDYPEFIDMTADDVSRMQALTAEPLPSLPNVSQYLGVSRKVGTLYVSFVPLVFREGRYQKLVSFRLSLHAQALTAASRSLQAQVPAAVSSIDSTGRYADHSVLATGQWVKISVPSSGVYQLTESLVRQAGFTDINKVKIYGYGGVLQPAVLTGNYLRQTDDLQEVPTYKVGNRRLFHAVGPVSWADATATTRTRNPYSDEGCYFLTQDDATEPLLVDSAAFIGAFYPAADDYHTLREVDDYAWYHSGRNLYESTPVSSNGSSTYELAAHDDSGMLTVVLASDGITSVSVELNDSLLGSIPFVSGPSDQEHATGSSRVFSVSGLLRGKNTIRLTQLSGDCTVRLDYLALTMNKAADAPDLTNTALPVPRLLYRITNQDHHADTAADLIIIIPTSQKILAQAERLKKLHEEHDSLRVRVVPADELYNEFSSGTPDANAYRRYLKMLYDRATTDADMPRNLLLFGDGAWDNRMLTSDWRQTTPDDFLLCFESENSFSNTDSYISDDFYCLLDDGEGNDLTQTDKTDMGVGRLTARTEAEAKILVDKIESYITNEYAGDWQNTVCFMGDDGNGNIHMEEAEAALQTIAALRPSFNLKRIYWDAYQRTVSSTGNSYPDVEQLIRQQMQEGALIMDYCGHGADYCLSHEKVVLRADFANPTSMRLPLWVTASCDIMPFDAADENIGETAMLNARGGAVAFFGTTRTVYTGDNKNMNCAFLKHALTRQADGRCMTLGDAVRLSKNELRFLNYEYKRINKLHYALLGDPAIRLAAPLLNIVIDSINGQPVADGNISIGAGQPVTVSGHVDSEAPFSGKVVLTVKDVEQQVVCRLNDTGKDGASVAYVFRDRPITLYNGQDSLRHGHFSQTFVLPQDITYSEATGRMMVYAVSSDRQSSASGSSEAFTMADGGATVTDGVGPSIYCYLNTAGFQNGGTVNTTPYFYAQLTDKDGINASGSSIGHDLELIVDGDPVMTYNLNSYFQYDFGDYRSGTVGFSLPTLSEGNHQLVFRAWDVLNNPSVAELNFRVARALQPNCFSVECTRNPATTQTSFIINHDRTGSQMDVELEVFDASGRMLWRKSETGVSTDNTYILDWDLTTSSGSRLQTGVYLYRVLISSDGSKRASQSQKLIVITNH